jgi:hypothetical protein
MGSYVGIDLHRRRSVVVVLDEGGERVSWSRFDNMPANLADGVVAAGGACVEVAMEATWGWCWAADVIAECGARLHLAHPLGIAGYENRRVKNDIRDATLLADLLRMGGCLRRGSPRRRSASCAKWCVAGTYADVGISAVGGIHLSGPGES